MSRFLRPAVLAATAAGGLFSAVSWSPSSPLALSASPSSSPSTPVGPADATGHIALVRAHPGLRELNAMLTPASFFVNATQTLLGTALRIAPFCPGSLRLARDLLTAEILSAEAESEGPTDAAAEQAVLARMHMALLNMFLLLYMSYCDPLVLRTENIVILAGGELSTEVHLDLGKQVRRSSVNTE
ncbi:hypothetical protein PVAP13_5NG387600 [Panicum virgatum]|uniref:Uncharacterized protein n=1 Tax=Panicum virgatum TaxID=38727 RepID=A0A8T0RX75_PANVG|nr:hypothetical protein PVAP13_5NG387600 [Panicum virgatum]